MSDGGMVAAVTRDLPDVALACPDCKAALPAPEECTACGSTFEREDGVPRLFPNRALTFSMERPPTATNPTHIDRSAFRMPVRTGQDGSGSYHLDWAHREVMDALPKGATVLEVGCGGGQHREWIKDLGLTYVGTDITNERVYDWLQSFGGADIFCDAHALPFADESMDVVYATAVWEHLAHPMLAAQEAARVLKPGGHFMGSVSFMEPWHDESYFHMSPNGVYEMLATAGLEPVAIWPDKTWTGFVAIMKMGNSVTRALSFLGRILGKIYLMPRSAKILAKSRSLPDDAALYEPRATVTGAMSWIARKPGGSE